MCIRDRFSTIANWIAAPFNGLLAEQLEARLTGATPPDTGVLGIMKDVPRIMKREWQKLAWYLPRAFVSVSYTHLDVYKRQHIWMQ